MPDPAPVMMVRLPAIAWRSPGSRSEAPGHDLAGQQPQRAQHVLLRHARPLHAADDVVDAEAADVVGRMARARLRRAEDEAAAAP